MSVLARLATVVRPVLGGVAAAFIVVGLLVLGQLDALDHWLLSRFYELRGPRPPTAPIVIVAIDEPTIAELNEWPFARAAHAEVIQQISAARPLAIGVDIIFDTPSSRGADDDRALTAAVASAGNVVLGCAYSVDTTFQQRATLACPTAEIRRGAAGHAPVNLRFDVDGAVRRASLAFEVGGERFDSFAVQLHRLAAKAGLPAQPVPAAPELHINFRGGPATFPWVPFYRVMRGEAPAEAFRGKIVLIGMTSQLQQDVFSTPFAHARTMPGVEIHANAIDTLVAGDAIREAPEWLNAGLAAAAAILGAALVVRLRALRAFIVVAAIWTALIVGGVALFSFSGVWIGGMGTTLCLILGYGATTIEHFIREQREKRQLSQFFSPAVLAHVVRRRGSLGSQRRLVTVLFSDVRDFTTMAEKLSAEQIAEILEEYLTAMTAIVFRHGGTVDKYIGDCVMALYNAPFDDPDHAAHAVRTALEIQERTREVSQKWEGRVGFPIRTGVGINTGEAVVGSLGSRQRREYTAIGDTINLGARLETITKDYRAGIIMSETTHRLVAGRFLSRELGTVTVKGKTQPVKIYAVVEREARTHPRTPVDAPATLIRSADGSERMVRVVNVGDGGVGMTGVPEEWVTGTTVSVHCDGGELAKPIHADGTIVWRRDDRGGISFNG